MIDALFGPQTGSRGRFARFAWLTLGYNLLVVAWGAFVRATGSGAGCGSHWPLCNGEVLPRAPRTETLIELSHRITSGLDGFIVLALVIAAFRVYPARHRVRWAAVVALIFLLGEVLLGAGLVHFELVAGNDSVARAIVMAFHLVNTFFLLGALAVTATWASGERRPELRGQGRVPWILAAGLVLLLLIGASGAVTALGDTLYPAEAFTSPDLSGTAHFLVRLRIFHPVLATVGGAFLLLVAARVARARPSFRVRSTAMMVAVLFLVEMVCGLLNVLLKAPVWIQLVHLLLADLVWIAFVALCVCALAVGTPREERLRLSPAEEPG